MISVVVPYKDAEAWVGNCCESLHDNSGEFEFIFVNDWSLDGGPEIVSRYMDIDNRFRNINNRNMAGVSGARNTGIDAARGEWVTFLDADDEMCPNAYSTMTKAARTGASMVQFNHLRYYAEKGKTVLKYTNDAAIYKIPTLPKMWFGVWNKLFRADFIKDVRFDETLQYGEDGLFVFECLAKDGRILHAGKNETTVVHRFVNKNSLSRAKGLVDIIKQLNAYEQFLLTHEAPEIRRTVCMEMARLWSKMAKEITK